MKNTTGIDLYCYLPPTTTVHALSVHDTGSVSFVTNIVDLQ